MEKIQLQLMLLTLGIKLADTILKDLTPNKIKTIIMKKMIDSY